MNKLIVFVLAVTFAACGKKEWTKQYVYDDCLKEMKKDKEAAALFTNDKMEQICDCSAAKTVDKYKSESEASKDQDGLMAIGRDCALEVLGGDK